MAITRSKLDKYLKELLKPELYNDYGPNGLQIEGSQSIKKIAFAVSAQRDSITKAVEMGADAMIVHHGLFWKFHGVRSITGSFAKRVKPLVQNDINLFGYHLPLDAHIEYGNAAAIAKRLNLINIEPFGDHKGMPIGVKGDFASEQSASEINKQLEVILNHQVINSKPQNEKKIKNMGIITGGANSQWSFCIKDELDSYLTGEMSEHDWHESAEEGITMFAGGHNATEQYGVLEVMTLIEKEFDVECFFIASENPA